jgi:hypothetical protein
MYKLFVDNNQIGIYKTRKEMFNDMWRIVYGYTTKSLYNNNNECFIELY